MRCANFAKLFLIVSALTLVCVAGTQHGHQFQKIPSDSNSIAESRSWTSTSSIGSVEAKLVRESEAQPSAPGGGGSVTTTTFDRVMDLLVASSKTNDKSRQNMHQGGSSSKVQVIQYAQLSYQDKSASDRMEGSGNVQSSQVSHFHHEILLDVDVLHSTESTPSLLLHSHGFGQTAGRPHFSVTSKREQSFTGQHNTVIACYHGAPCVDVVGATVSLHQVRIVNTLFNTLHGLGIWAQYLSSVLPVESKFSDSPKCLQSFNSTLIVLKSVIGPCKTLGSGAGIAASATNVTILDSRVEGNTASFQGAGVFLNSSAMGQDVQPSSLTMRSVEVVSNSIRPACDLVPNVEQINSGISFTGAGVMAISDTNETIVENCTFADNQIFIACSGSACLWPKKERFGQLDPGAAGAGAAFDVAQPDVTNNIIMKQSIFQNNSISVAFQGSFIGSVQSGAVQILHATTISVLGCSFSGNTVFLSGGPSPTSVLSPSANAGAIFTPLGAIFSIRDCEFTSNFVQAQGINGEVSGGAALLNCEPGSIISRSSFDGNEVLAGVSSQMFSLGGVLSVGLGSGLLIEDTEIKNGKAQCMPTGCLSVGGGIYVDDVPNITTRGVKFENNVVSCLTPDCIAFGGGINFRRGYDFNIDSGTCFTNNVCNCTGVGCHASGAALYDYNYKHDQATASGNSSTQVPSVIANGVLLQNNHVECKGVNCSAIAGAVYSLSSMKIQNSTFINNQCRSQERSANIQGGAFYCIAPNRIYSSNGTRITATFAAYINIFNSTFIGNSLNSKAVNSLGGAMMVDRQCTVTAEDSEFRSNKLLSSSSASGGALSLAGHFKGIRVKFNDHREIQTGGLGSAIYAASNDADESSLSLKECTFDENAAYATVGIISVAGPVAIDVSGGYIRVPDSVGTVSLAVDVTARPFSIGIPADFVQCANGSISRIENYSGQRAISELQLDCITEACKFTAQKFSVNVEILQSFTSQCFPCQPGSYNMSQTIVELLEEPPAKQCSLCPFGADCLGGNEVHSLPGYWGWMKQQGPSGHLHEFALLPQGYGCQSGQCFSFNSCAPGRQGVLCGQCTEGTTQVFLSPACVDSGTCRTSRSKALAFIPLIFLLFSVSFLLEGLRFLPKLLVFKTSGTLQILVAFYQTALLLLSESGWSHSSNVVSSAILSTFNGFPIDNSGSGICIFDNMTYALKLGSRVILACIFLLVLLIVRVGLQLFWKFNLANRQRAGQGHRPSSLIERGVMMASLQKGSTGDSLKMESMAANVSTDAVPFFVCVQLVITSVVEASIRSWQCQWLPDLGNRWFYDGSVECYNGVQLLAMCSTVFLCIVLPVAWYRLSHYVHEQHRNGKLSSFTRPWMLGLVLFFEGPYNPGRVDGKQFLLNPKSAPISLESIEKETVRQSVVRNWGVVMIMRRMSIALTMLMIPFPVVRQLVSCTQLLVLLILHLVLQPFDPVRRARREFTSIILEHDSGTSANSSGSSVGVGGAYDLQESGVGKKISTNAESKASKNRSRTLTVTAHPGNMTHQQAQSSSPNMDVYIAGTSLRNYPELKLAMENPDKRAMVLLHSSVLPSLRSKWLVLPIKPQRLESCCLVLLVLISVLQLRSAALLSTATSLEAGINASGPVEFDAIKIASYCLLSAPLVILIGEFVLQALEKREVSSSQKNEESRPLFGYTSLSSD